MRESNLLGPVVDGFPVPEISLGRSNSTNHHTFPEPQRVAIEFAGEHPVREGTCRLHLSADIGGSLTVRPLFPTGPEENSHTWRSHSASRKRAMNSFAEDNQCPV